ncbi:MAG: two pore domain potassium channel family protein [Alphaproteobacteria bacterium]|nr:two pore domain potassium channel family protein [Alphaproteobacteria bacterium]
MNRLLGRAGLGGIGFTTMLVGLIAAAAAEYFDLGFIIMLVAMVLGAVAFFLRAFPGSRFFAIAFANGLAVYTSLFVVFTEVNFAQVGVFATRIGFILPFLAFLAGAWIRRDRIRRIVLADRVADAEEVARSFLWLVPVFGIGVLTFVLPTLDLSARAADLAFLAAMAAIAAIVFAVSADVSSFLIETGLLFEEFFERIAKLVVPTFAFLTFYSVTVIVFASLYRILDRLATTPNFTIGGAHRALTFPESLYFSIVTMATVGYGDIVPSTDAARALAAIQVVLGVLILLIGFSEIFSYTRERRRGRNEN